jgi:hypothetical protein
LKISFDAQHNESQTLKKNFKIFGPGETFEVVTNKFEAEKNQMRHVNNKLFNET